MEENWKNDYGMLESRNAANVERSDWRMTENMQLSAMDDQPADLQNEPGVGKAAADDLPEKCTDGFWHFFSDGHAVNNMFPSDEDYIHAMNIAGLLTTKYNVTILAFVLMDNHFHFILQGEYFECSKYIRCLLRNIAQHLRYVHGEVKALHGTPIGCKAIKTYDYLKTVICYVIKNPAVARTGFTVWDYPWGSGPLYFRNRNSWATAGIMEKGRDETCIHPKGKMRNTLYTNFKIPVGWKFADGTLIWPGNYVATELVERLFVTSKAFSYILGKAKDVDDESDKFRLGRIGLTDREARQHRDALMADKFNAKSIRTMAVPDRIKLGHMLKREFRLPDEQIARVVGLDRKNCRRLFD